MKSIMYVGAILMIGASIYGFVDFKKTSHNKEFKNMYAEKKVIDAEPTSNKKAASPATITEMQKNNEVKKVAIKNNKKAIKLKKSKKFNTNLFSRGALDERFIEPVKETEKDAETFEKENKE